MQKKIAKNKVDSKDKKAPRKGASRESIFNYDIEVTEEMDKKREEKKLRLQKQREKEQKKIEKEKRKRLEKLKKEKSEKSENQTIEVLTEEKFIGAKELPPVNKKAIEKLKKQKRKAKNKRKKEIIKQAKREEKERLKRQRPQITEKQARQIKKVKKALINVSLIILIITAITLFLLSPIFSIENISIKNNEKLSQEEIISLSQIEKGTNLFKIRNAEIKNNIKENAYVDEVKVNRILPNTIEITVTERQVAYLLEYGSSYAYIDEQGYILEISSENITDKIKIRGYKTTEDNIKPRNRLIKEDLNKLNDVAIITDTAKNSGINAQITSINIENQNEYSLYMESEKKTVHIGSISNLDTKMLYLQVMLEKEKDNEGEIFLNIDFKTKNPYFKEKV
jgi:cell division protein FtsQ